MIHFASKCITLKHLETVLDKSLRAAVLLCDLVFLNGSTRNILSDGLDGLLKPAIGPELGAAQAVVYFPDDTGEVLVNILGQVSYLPRFLDNNPGPLQWLLGIFENWTV